MVLVSLSVANASLQFLSKKIDIINNDQFKISIENDFHLGFKFKDVGHPTDFSEFKDEF